MSSQWLPASCSDQSEEERLQAGGWFPPSSMLRTPAPVPRSPIARERWQILLFISPPFPLLPKMTQTSTPQEAFLGASRGICPNPVHPMVCPRQGPPRQRLGAPRWQRGNLVHPLLPLHRRPAFIASAGPLHTVWTSANSILFQRHQGSWLFKEYYRRSFGKDWNHFDSFLM